MSYPNTQKNLTKNPWSFLLIIAIVFSSITSGFAQCGTANYSITIETQTQVDNFISTYCTNYLGSIIIEDDNDGIDNITNLLPLIGLNSIGGSLRIRNNPYLLNIDGLESLTAIERVLTISNNDHLTNIDGLIRVYPIIIE